MTGKIEVEGASLEEALSKAAETLGLERREVAFEYDRAHLAGGASTVRIWAWKQGPMDRVHAESSRRELREPSARPRPFDRPRDRDNRRRPLRPPRGSEDATRGPHAERRGGPDELGPRRQRHDPERDEQLKASALALADRVLRGEGSQSIASLNSYERHIVHTVVREKDSQLTTESRGEGLRKDVWISLASPK